MPQDDSLPDELQHLPVFDEHRFDVLSELVSPGDEEVLAEIVRQFLDDLGPLLRRIEDGVAERDFQQVADGAHALKGSAGQFGMVQVERAAHLLEVGAKGGNEKEAERWLGFLKGALPGGVGPLERRLRGS